MKNDFLRFEDQEARHRLILLHGWGADAEDLIPIGHELIKSLPEKFELLALRAPQLHPDGTGRQWYGLFPAEWASVPKATKLLQNQIISIENKKISLSKTFVLGFSQGAAMAINSCCDLNVGGIISCSGYPHPSWQAPQKSPRIFLTHGINDEVVPKEASEKLYDQININNENIDIFLFQGGHEISERAISKIKLTLNKWIDSDS